MSTTMHWQTLSLGAGWSKALRSRIEAGVNGKGGHDVRWLLKTTHGRSPARRKARIWI